MVLDPAVKSAELIAFNNLVSLSPLPLTYHLPCLQGFRSVEDEDPKLILGIVILGSLASVNDRQPWQLKLEEWLFKMMKKKIPTFGICYGHQMISHLFDGKVECLNPDRSKEIGLRKLTLEPNVLWGKKPVTGHLYTSHEEVVTVMPKEMHVIARSDRVEIDGLAHKKLPIWTFQPHPEATPDFLHRSGIDHKNPDFTFGYRLIKNFFDYAKKQK